VYSAVTAAHMCVFGDMAADVCVFGGHGGECTPIAECMEACALARGHMAPPVAL
jgi:hypothetical protein